MCGVGAALLIESREKEFISERKCVSLVTSHRFSNLFLCDAAAIGIAVVPDKSALHFGDHFLAAFRLNHCMRHCFHFNNINLTI